MPRLGGKGAKRSWSEIFSEPEEAAPQQQRRSSKIPQSAQLGTSAQPVEQPQTVPVKSRASKRSTFEKPSEPTGESKPEQSTKDTKVYQRVQQHRPKKVGKDKESSVLSQLNNKFQSTDRAEATGEPRAPDLSQSIATTEKAKRKTAKKLKNVSRPDIEPEKLLPEKEETLEPALPNTDEPSMEQDTADLEGDGASVGDDKPIHASSGARGAHLKAFFPAISSTKSGKYQTLSKARGLHVKTAQEASTSRFAELNGLRRPDDEAESRRKSPCSSVTLGRDKQDDAAAGDANQESAEQTVVSVVDQTSNDLAVQAANEPGQTHMKVATEESSNKTDPEAHAESDQASTASTAATAKKKKKKKKQCGAEKKRKQKAARDAAQPDVDKLASLFLPRRTEEKEGDCASVSSTSTTEVTAKTTIPLHHRIFTFPVQGVGVDEGCIFTNPHIDTSNTGVWAQRQTADGHLFQGYEYKPAMDAQGCPTSRWNNIHGFDEPPKSQTIWHGLYHPETAIEEVTDMWKAIRSQLMDSKAPKDASGMNVINDDSRALMDSEGNVKIINKKGTGKRRKKPSK